jgi:hypothetical protein
MGQIFISYRHVEPDESLARALVVALDARRHPVFIDARIEVGTRWVAEIERQIRASAYFVVVLSEHSIRSDMVRQEVALAHELEEDGRMRILPIRAGFDGALPYDLASYLNPIQYAFWRPGSPFDEICGQIVAPVDKAAALPLTTPAGEDSSVLDGESVPDGPAPLPSADPRIVMETGTVRLSSPFYVVRRSDELMERALGRDEGATLVVKGVRQSGKSSLLARAHALSHKLGRRSIYVDFQQLDSRHLESLGSLMRNLAARIARELRTDVKPGDVWDDDLGDKESFADFIESAVLAAEEEPVLLCLDEVDRLFDRPYRADFFAAVRGWHNNRAISPIWDRLHLAIAHATDPTLWIDDINQSPFNVGERLRLEDFTVAEIRDLAKRHGERLARMEIVDGLHRLVGGQPYLVRQALCVLVNEGWSVDELHRVAIEERGPFGDHLAQAASSLKATATSQDAWPAPGARNAGGAGDLPSLEEQAEQRIDDGPHPRGVGLARRDDVVGVPQFTGHCLQHFKAPFFLPGVCRAVLFVRRPTMGGRFRQEPG